MLENILDIAVLIAIAMYFYYDYKKVKRGGGNLQEYVKGILIFIALLTILSLIL